MTAPVAIVAQAQQAVHIDRLLDAIAAVESGNHMAKVGLHGERSTHAKLTEIKVRRIYAAVCSGRVSQKEIALEHGVGAACIQKILAGVTWKHLGLGK